MEMDAPTRYSNLMRLRERIWLFLEETNSSTGATVYSYVMSVIILGAVVGVIMGTMPAYLAYTQLDNLNIAVNVIFTADVALRILVAPSVKGFLRSFYNCVDVLVIVPFYVSLAVSITFGSTGYVILLIRPILYLLKITRNFYGFRLLVRSLTLSAESLPVPLFLLLVIVITSAALLYYVESGSNPNIKSIPDAMWFSIVTVSTVGYGDVVPVTTAGKLTASVLIMLGLMYMAMPLSIVGSNFTAVWQDRDRILLIERTRQRLKQMGLNADSVKGAFQVFDLDGSGTIELSEFEAVVKDLKLGLTEDKTVELFACFDGDNDGICTFAEFAKVMFPDNIWTEEELKKQQEEVINARPDAPAPRQSLTEGIESVSVMPGNLGATTNISNDKMDEIVKRLVAERLNQLNRAIEILEDAQSPKRKSN